MEDKQLTINISSWTMIRALVIILLFVALYLIRDIVLIILTSVVIASAIEPATKWLMKYRLPRVIAVIILFLVFFVLFAGFFYFFLPPLLDDISGFISSIPGYLDSFNLSGQGGKNSTIGISGAQSIIDNLSGATLSPREFISELKSVFFDPAGGIFHGVSIVFGGIFSSVLIVVISFYLAVQREGIENFLRTVTPIKNESYVLDLWARTRHKIGLWMQGQLILALLMGVFVYLGLAILNLPYAFLLAVLAALFELIPIFGPILAAVPAVAIAFTNGGPGMGLTVIGFYVIMQQFENHLIYPLVVRKVIGVPPLIVILALLIFWELFGFLGILISVPVVTMFLEIASDLEKSKRRVEITAV